MFRLLIVDDHTAFRESLAFMLDRVEDFSVVAQVGNVARAREAIRSSGIDLALLDIDLAGDHGLDLIPELRIHHPGAVGLVLTGNIGVKTRALAVAAGAVGVLHKSASFEEVVTAIRQAVAGTPLISPREAAELMQEGTIYLANRDAGRAALQQLSPREQDVLRALAAGLDNQGIAERLFVSTETVRTHIVRIYRKLGVDSRLQAVIFAARHQFLKEEDFQ